MSAAPCIWFHAGFDKAFEQLPMASARKLPYYCKAAAVSDDLVEKDLSHYHVAAVRVVQFRLLLADEDWERQAALRFAYRRVWESLSIEEREHVHSLWLELVSSRGHDHVPPVLSTK